MFQHIQSYKNELVSFLTSMNENIDWETFVNTNMSLDPEKLIGKLKSLLWIDKNLSYDKGLQNNLKNFTRYTTLIHKYWSVLFAESTIHIIDISDDTAQSLSEFIIEEVKDRISVLCRLFDIMNIKYELIKSVPNDSKILIPTGSITYKNPNSLLTNFKGLMLIDDFYNIYENENENELNYFKLTILQLTKNVDITIPELLSQQYGFLKFTKTI